MDKYSYDLGCNVGIDTTCLPNEICRQNHPKSRAGTCKCKPGFIRNSRGDCIDSGEPLIRPVSEILEDRFLDGAVNNTREAVTRKPLTVESINQQVKLPDDEVTLVATVRPDDSNQEDKYQYEWTSLQQPDGSTAVKHQNAGQLQLTKLVEGLYTFKVFK